MRDESLVWERIVFGKHGGDESSLDPADQELIDPVAAFFPTLAVLSEHKDGPR